MTSAAEQPGTHVDLILQQIGSLPTLSPIAVRVMQAANSGDADLREIARMIESDPALTAKVLALCRRADWATSKKVVTVDRAVVILGLEAVRAAVLSVEIHEAFAHAIEKPSSPQNRRAGDPEGERSFDRKELWRHSIAVAASAELIAESLPHETGGYSVQEAFLAGLLHDLGKVALDALLPRSYERVVAISRERQMNVAEVERRILGIDHHTVGKRLAEHWGLPHALQDVMWLHNQPAHLLPDVHHRPLIAMVTIADAHVRRMHIGSSGNGVVPPELSALCDQFGLSWRKIRETESELIDRVARRCAHLGLDEVTPGAIMLESIARANGHLGRVTALLDRRARDAQRTEAALSRVSAFLANEPKRRSFASALAEVGSHAAEVVGGSFLAVVCEFRAGTPWLVHRAGPGSPESASSQMAPPPSVASLAALAESHHKGAQDASTLAWLAERVVPEAVRQDLRVLPLIAGAPGLTSILLHTRADAERDLGEKGLRALASAWGAALCSASRHDGARRMGEQLADANRRLSEAQSRLVEQKAMSHLARVAAGAAHEMNNPLTIISGMSQVLLEGLREPEKRTAAVAIVHASERLSELITSLHLFADPPKPKRAPTDVVALLHKSVAHAKKRVAPTGSKAKNPPRIDVTCEPGLGAALIDPDQIQSAISELIVNALQSGPKRAVQIRAYEDPFDSRLVISIIDDGTGMSSSALEHAFDPFFSELPAGRRTGLGLTRARRYADLHGGELVLESEAGKGTTARIILPDWRDARGQNFAEEAA